MKILMPIVNAEFYIHPPRHWVRTLRSPYTFNLYIYLNKKKLRNAAFLQFTTQTNHQNTTYRVS